MRSSCLYKGDVEYVNENNLIRPKKGDVISTLPQKMHTARLLKPCIYERYVLKFNINLFSDIIPNGLLSFVDTNCLISANDSVKSEVIDVLHKMEDELNNDTENSNIVTLGYTILLFSLLCKSNDNFNTVNETIPENIYKIKNYIDNNFTDIDSISELASHFYYSSEYISRLFKKYFNTTISKYILMRKLSESKKLLLSGSSVTGACYNSGLRNTSTFINVFTSYYGETPHQYKKTMSSHII